MLLYTIECCKEYFGKRGNLRPKNLTLVAWIAFGLLVAACDNGSSPAKTPCEETPALCTPLDTMLELGQEVYQSCTGCHGIDGRGEAGVNPPVANSDYFMNNKYKAVEIVLMGMTDSVFVNGQWYNGEMPSHFHYSDLEVASVLNYIRVNFNDSITVSCDSTVLDANKFAVCERIPRTETDRLTDTIAAWEVKAIRDSLEAPLGLTN